MSHFGDLVRKLRKEKGLTLEAVAKKIGSHKGYVSGIEYDKVNPPSVKIIQKFAKIFGQDARALARLAWVDKAPEILKTDAENLLRWCQGPGELMDCLSQWEKFLHRRDLPPLVQIALAHYQFEAIHPFLDGNGRVGRLLITLTLVEREVLPTPLLYLSAFFEATRREYYAGL